MMNFLGKTLVLIHVTLSVLAMAFAAAILLQFVDWGWKQPRLEVNERVPSELDKRIATVNQAVRARDAALAPMLASRKALDDAMDRYGKNHLFYRDELERLAKYDGQAPLVAKEVTVQDGVVALDTPRIGQPKLDQKIDDIDKSLKQYEEVLVGKDALYKQIDDLEAKLRDATAKAEKLTRQLNGMDAKGNVTQIGLYKLLEDEAAMQARIRFEKQYLEPQWAEALKSAQDSLERRDRLQQSLDRLEKDLGKGGKK